MSAAAFAKALGHFDGNQSALAKAIGTSQQRVHYVISKGNPCPPDLVIKTEQATGISRHDLRVDLYPREQVAA